jgi:hypothetical protein
MRSFEAAGGVLFAVGVGYVLANLYIFLVHTPLFPVVFVCQVSRKWALQSDAVPRSAASVRASSRAAARAADVLVCIAVYCLPAGAVAAARRALCCKIPSLRSAHEFGLLDLFARSSFRWCATASLRTITTGGTTTASIFATA